MVTNPVQGQYAWPARRPGRCLCHRRYRLSGRHIPNRSNAYRTNRALAIVVLFGDDPTGCAIRGLSWASVAPHAAGAHSTTARGHDYVTGSARRATRPARPAIAPRRRDVPAPAGTPRFPSLRGPVVARSRGRVPRRRVAAPEQDDRGPSMIQPDRRSARSPRRRSGPSGQADHGQIASGAPAARCRPSASARSARHRHRRTPRRRAARRRIASTHAPFSLHEARAADASPR